MEILGTKRFIPKGFELGTTELAESVHCIALQTTIQKLLEASRFSCYASLKMVLIFDTIKKALFTFFLTPFQACSYIYILVKW